MRSDHEPRVTIGLPVYNGAKYLMAAIESILGQTCRDFQLIISDNASTDDTAEICKRYAASDDRVTYHRQERNIGVGPNHDWCARRATGLYFKWASHDDILEPEFLERCVEALDANPDAVLCHSRTKIIGRAEETFAARLPGLDSPRASDRFAALVLKPHWAVELLGVIRTSVLQQTELSTGYFGRDKALLAELALRGRLLQVPEPLFLNRDHPERSMRAVPFHKRQSFHDSRNVRPVITHWVLYADYWRAIGSNVRDPVEKARCYRALAHWWFVNMHAARIVLDVLYVKFPAIAVPMYRLRDIYHRRGIGARNVD